MSSTQGNYYTALDGLRFGIVEDNAYFRRLVRTMLTGLGVKHIFDGATISDGWEMVTRHHPDVLLLDWNIEGEDSTVLLDRIRTDPDNSIATQIVVFLSAHSDKAHVLAAARLGANDFIVKPISARVLYERIRRLCQANINYMRRGGRLVPVPNSSAQPAKQQPKFQGKLIPIAAPAGVKKMQEADMVFL